MPLDPQAHAAASSQAVAEVSFSVEQDSWPDLELGPTLPGSAAKDASAVRSCHLLIASVSNSVASSEELHVDAVVTRARSAATDYSTDWA
jgi:hypothetical protein